MTYHREERRFLVLVTAGAVLLRLALLLGRGHYVAFDEGWYLLLGQNLWSGEGYTLSGLRHVALSPLFPILAGGLGRILGDPVWGGRIVAAVSSGLLVIPAWSVFRRIGGPKGARVGIAFVALMPSLAPFVVPYWVGWDLWVGAEPLLHLLLFSGMALFLESWVAETRGKRLVLATACGLIFAMAYLARPEAVATFGLLGLAAVMASARALRSRWGRIVVCSLAFVVVAAPYWIYLHDSLGRWTITGRAVQTVPQVVLPTGGEGSGAGWGTGTGQARIEAMLWEGDTSRYIQGLYSLDESGTSLAASYWGIIPPDADSLDRGNAGTASTRSGTPEQATPSGAASPTTEEGPAPREGAVAPERRSTLGFVRYAEALGVAVPWYAWLLVVPGLLAPGRERRLDLELLVGLPLVATSLLIARVVAIDPRTQLFIAPLAAFYAGRGVLVVADRISERMGEHVRREIVTRILVGAVAAIMLGTSAVRLTMSLTVGSPHHVVAAQNAAVGEAIRQTTTADATVMSFHPALALFADRDWRVLPLEPMDRIVRYARTQPNPHLVLSVFYPPELRPAEEPHYLIVPVPPDLPESDRWRIDIPELRTVLAFGELVPME